MEEVDKVFFLWWTNLITHQLPDSVCLAKAAGPKRNIEKDDCRVTTIQKHLTLHSEGQHVSKASGFHFWWMSMFSVCEAQSTGQKFKQIEPVWVMGTDYECVVSWECGLFSVELQRVITDAIRDQKVLKFMVDYNDVRPQFKSIGAWLDQVICSWKIKKLLHPTNHWNI